jgi:hypothetical protein
MLGDAEHQRLDEDLRALVCLLEDRASWGEIRACAERVADDVSPHKGEPGDPSRYLLRPGWQEVWRTQRTVLTSWFGDVDHVEVDGLLHAAFMHLVEIVAGDVGPYRQQQSLRDLHLALLDYLTYRSAIFPGSAEPALPCPLGPDGAAALRITTGALLDALAMRNLPETSSLTSPCPAPENPSPRTRKRPAAQRHQQWAAWREEGLSYGKIARRHKQETNEIVHRTTIQKALKRRQRK